MKSVLKHISNLEDDAIGVFSNFPIWGTVANGMQNLIGPENPNMHPMILKLEVDKHLRNEIS